MPLHGSACFDDAQAPHFSQWLFQAIANALLLLALSVLEGQRDKLAERLCLLHVSVRYTVVPNKPLA